MKATLLRAGDFRRQPWKNGGGVTTELAVEGEPPDWIWRLSVAHVEGDGPFSDFSGYDRTILLLDGKGMVLTFDAAPEKVLDTPHVPFTFDGGWRTHCRLLGGPVKDLNLMVDRARARAELAVRVVDGSRLAFDSRWRLLYALRGGTRLQWDDGEETVLEARELLRVDGATGEQATAAATTPGSLLADIRIEEAPR